MLPTAARTADIPRGIAMRIGAMMMFALMAALLKLASTRGAGLAEIFFYRAFFGLPLLLAWVLLGPGLRALVPNRPIAHVSRSAIGMVSMLCTFEALILLPLAEATTITFTGPIFATLLSWMILHEKIGRHRIAAAMVGFLGVIVVMRPGASTAAIAPLGVAFGLVAAFGQASVTVALRHLGATENVAAIVFWFLAACSLVGAIMLAFFGVPLDRATMLILVGAGICGGLAQIWMTASLQAAPIAVLAPFDYLHLIGAVALGWLLIGTEPTLNTYAGATLIAASGLYTVWREHRRRQALSAIEPLT